MAIRLSTSHLRQSFQLLAHLSNPAMEEGEAFERASNLVYEWGKQKFSKIFDLPYRKTSLDLRRDGNELGVLYDQAAGRFFFRGTHPDTQVPGRMWITDVELRREDGLFAVRLSVSSLQDCTEEVPFSCPGFVRRIMDSIGVVDGGLPILSVPRRLAAPEEVERLLEAIESPARSLPVFLLTPCNDAEAGYLMDGADMAANQLIGIAHVVELTAEMSEYCTERLGREWSAYNGAVRTYYPGTVFAEENYFRHPLLTQQRIRLRDAVEGEGISRQAVESYIQSFALRRPIPWAEAGVDFYPAAYQEQLRTQRLAESGRSKKALVDAYEGELQRLQEQRDENLALAESFAKDMEEIQEACDDLRQQNQRLKTQIELLRYRLRESGREEQVFPEKMTYEGLSDWAQSRLADRVKLLSRAVRSLKSAVYEDPGLVYRCVNLLATAYYDYRLGTISYEAFTSACKTLDAGLEERGAITDTAAGMQGETYFVSYQGRREKLERHLAKGNSKDRRYCLRIYFFWDEQDQMVVIGDLPHHLDTTAT